MSKVDFDGTNKIIIVKDTITSLTVLPDIYSQWKIWALEDDNSKYLQAMSAIGGDPITQDIFLGTTFFLENDWKIRPHEANHSLDINGNLFTRDGTSPFVSTIGNYNVMVRLTTSNQINTVNLEGGGPSTTELANAVWSKPKNEITSNNSIGKVVINTENAVGDTQALIFAK